MLDCVCQAVCCHSIFSAVCASQNVCCLVFLASWISSGLEEMMRTVVLEVRWPCMYCVSFNKTQQGRDETELLLVSCPCRLFWLFAHLATEATSDSNLDFLRLNKRGLLACKKTKTPRVTLPSSIVFSSYSCFSRYTSENHSLTPLVVYNGTVSLIDIDKQLFSSIYPFSSSLVRNIWNFCVWS